MQTHAMDIRIYYEDTDAGGVVYHASYLKFAERGRTEFLRNLGHQNSELTDEYGIIFVVRHIEIDYLLPGFLDDLLTMQTTIKELKNSSFVMHQVLSRKNTEEGEAEKICDMRVALVCIDNKGFRPVRLPGPVKEQFQNYVE